VEGRRLDPRSAREAEGSVTNTQVFGLGAMFVVGMALHGALSRGPSSISTAADRETTIEVERQRAEAVIEAEKVRTRSAERLALLERGFPTTVVVGERTLFVVTVWHEKNGDFEVTRTYYEYRDGKLVQVPLEATPTKK
jgi:hypothetical protein